MIWLGVAMLIIALMFNIVALYISYQSGSVISLTIALVATSVTLLGFLLVGWVVNHKLEGSTYCPV